MILRTDYIQLRTGWYINGLITPIGDNEDDKSRKI